RRAADESFSERETAVEQLAHNDDPATRDLLLRLLSTDEDSSIQEAAMKAARELWGADSLEPDYALLQNPAVEDPDEVEDSIKRVQEKGEPKRMFEILAKASDEVQQVIAASLRNRAEPPIGDAQAAIGSNSERTVQVAAQILGRAGSKAAGAG